jgi:hypothetical protein
MLLRSMEMDFQYCQLQYTSIVQQVHRTFLQSDLWLFSVMLQIQAQTACALSLGCTDS